MVFVRFGDLRGYTWGAKEMRFECAGLYLRHLVCPTHSCLILPSQPERSAPHAQRIRAGQSETHPLAPRDAAFSIWLNEGAGQQPSPAALASNPRQQPSPTALASSPHQQPSTTALASSPPQSFTSRPHQEPSPAALATGPRQQPSPAALASTPRQQRSPEPSPAALARSPRQQLHRACKPLLAEACARCSLCQWRCSAAGVRPSRGAAMWGLAVPCGEVRASGGPAKHLGGRCWRTGCVRGPRLGPSRAGETQRGSLSDFRWGCQGDSRGIVQHKSAVFCCIFWLNFA